MVCFAVDACAPLPLLVNVFVFIVSLYIDINLIYQYRMMKKELSICKLNDTIQLEFSLKNTSMNMYQLIDKSIIDILYSVHKGDIIQCYTLENDFEGDNTFQKLKVVFVQLFRDIGMPHMFLNMDIMKTHTEDSIRFNCVKNADLYPIEGVCVNTHSANAPIVDITVVCNFTDIHTCRCIVNVNHEPNHDLVRFESIVMSIFKKMFKKVKTFIEMAQ